MRARPLRVTAVLALAVALVLVVRTLKPAVDIATGYAAKQVCSGIYVAGLPAEFVVDSDVRPAMAVMGPLLPALEVGVAAPGIVRATLFGAASQATFTGDTGCVLNPDPGVRPAAVGATHAKPAVAIRPVPPPVSLHALFDSAFEEPPGGQRRTLAIVVMRHGDLVGERYADGITALTPLQGWSMNKSLMATWVGLQVARGALSLEAPVRPVVAQIDAALAENIDPALQLSHLLHMESGFDFEETYFPGDDATRMLYRSRAMWRIAPGNGHRYSPGVQFSYSSGDTNLAAMLWERSLGGQSYMDWINTHFVTPLGLADVTSEPDASGIQVGSSYTWMPARAWARVGQLWLDAWHGRSDLLSSNWMRESVTPRRSSKQGNYGRGFWLNTRGDQFPGLPTDLFYASGHNSQYVMVLPEEELVIVRLGLTSEGGSDGFAAFVAGLLAAR